ncbi:hypothetical protein [Desulfosporosinus sp. BG]|uniref:hypothetical protein n=1 Tax=Desulfosporosinus sp. BG TaxID=1633135 RepID=UPI00083AE5A7|nr:hypothetical protein [Desulfosporosinus sp. BG]
MRKLKNRLSLLFFLVFAVVLLSSGLLNSVETPKLQKSVVLSSISEEEFNMIGHVNKSAEARREDFKKLTIKVGILNSKSMKSREISISDVLYSIDHYDRVRSSISGDYKQNNVGKEDFARSSKYVVFDARGLNTKDYSKMFNDLNITVSWTLGNGEAIRNVFPIYTLLEFKN